jgi:hypothetical protein
MLSSSWPVKRLVNGNKGADKISCGEFDSERRVLPANYCNKVFVLSDVQMFMMK